MKTIRSTCLALALAPLFIAVACAQKGVPSTSSAEGNPTTKSIRKEFTATNWATHQETYTMLDDPRDELDILGGGTQIVDHFIQSKRAFHHESFAMPIASSQFATTSGEGAKLDLLLVVDSSGDMADERTQLASGLAPLLAGLNGLDWQIGVIGTDPTATGCLGALVKGQDADGIAKLSAAIAATSTDGTAAFGILQAGRALAGCAGREPWLREKSTLAVLIVSNKDNCGGTKCTMSLPADADFTTADLAASSSASFLTDAIASLGHPGTQAKVFGLIWNAAQTKDQCPQGAGGGQIYAEAARTTSGSLGSVCDKDYTASLQIMAGAMKAMADATIQLPFEAIDGSVKVTVDQTATDRILVQGPVVTLIDAPVSGAKIVVDYSYVTTASASFKLGAAAAMDSLALTLDGKTLKTADFSYNETTQTLTLTRALAGKTLAVAYRDATDAIHTIFTLKSAAADPASLAVSVNGKDLTAGDYTFDAVKGEISFKTPPEDGSAMTVTYQPKDARRTSYPLLLGDSQRLSLQVTDRKSGAEIPFTADGQTIAFTDELIQSGADIVITYDMDGAQSNTLDMGREVMSFDELTITNNTAAVDCPREKLKFAGSKVNLAGCNFKAGDKITATHKYIAASSKNFMLDDPRLKEATQVALSVMVDGVATEDYSFDLKTDTLTMYDLGVADTVTVEAVFY